MLRKYTILYLLNNRYKETICTHFSAQLIIRNLEKEGAKIVKVVGQPNRMVIPDDVATIEECFKLIQRKYRKEYRDGIIEFEIYTKIVNKLQQLNINCQTLEEYKEEFKKFEIENNYFIKKIKNGGI